MSYDLPQATKTRKFQSLNEDQRKIAEELIAKKFDVKEEVVSKRDTSFREHCTCGPEYATRCRIHDLKSNVDYGRMDSFYGDRDIRNGIETRVDFSTHRRVSSITIDAPTSRSIRDCLMRFDMENLPRHDRKIYAPKRFLQYMLQDEGFRHYIEVSDRDRGYEEQVVARIFGCPIVVAPEGTRPYIQVMY